MEVIEKSGHKDKIKIGNVVAVAEFLKDGKYDFDFKNPRPKSESWISGAELMKVYEERCNSTP